jgi:hypothetical protein
MMIVTFFALYFKNGIFTLSNKIKYVVPRNNTVLIK